MDSKTAQEYCVSVQEDKKEMTGNIFEHFRSSLDDTLNLRALCRPPSRWTKKAAPVIARFELSTRPRTLFGVSSVHQEPP